MSLRGLLGRQEDSLAVQSIILTAARAASFVITFAIPIVLVRVFDQSTFGIYKQLMLLLGTAIPILNLGMYASIFYFVPRDRGEGQRFVLQAIGVLTLMGAVGGLVVVIGADGVTAFFGDEAVRAFLPLLAVLILLSTPAQLVDAVPVVDRRPTLAAFTMAANDLLRATALVAIALLTRSLTAVLWAAVLAAAVRAVWLALYVRIRRVGRVLPPGLSDLRKQLAYALPFAAAVVFQIGHQQFHQYYVAAQVTSAEFAIYAVGILQVPIVGMLTMSVVEVMLVRMTAAFEQGELGEARRVWRAALTRLGVILVPCWVLAQVLASDIIVLLFGAAYAGAVPIFRLFVSNVLLWIIVDHSVLRSTGDTRFVFWANVAGFMLSVPAVVLLSKLWGLPGAVAGFLAGLLVMRVMGLFKVAQRLDLSWSSVVPVPALARTLTASLVSGGMAATALLLPGRFLRLAVGGTVFSISYAALVLRMRIVPREEFAALVRRFTPRYFSKSSTA